MAATAVLQWRLDEKRAWLRKRSKELVEAQGVGADRVEIEWEQGVDPLIRMGEEGWILAFLVQRPGCSPHAYSAATARPGAGLLSVQARGCAHGRSRHSPASPAPSHSPRRAPREQHPTAATPHAWPAPPPGPRPPRPPCRTAPAGADGRSRLRLPEPTIIKATVSVLHCYSICTSLVYTLVREKTMVGVASPTSASPTRRRRTLSPRPMKAMQNKAKGNSEGVAVKRCKAAAVASAEAAAAAGTQHCNPPRGVASTTAALQGASVAEATAEFPLLHDINAAPQPSQPQHSAAAAAAAASFGAGAAAGVAQQRIQLSASHHTSQRCYLSHITPRPRHARAGERDGRRALRIAASR